MYLLHYLALCLSCVNICYSADGDKKKPRTNINAKAWLEEEEGANRLVKKVILHNHLILEFGDTWLNKLKEFDEMKGQEEKRLMAYWKNVDHLHYLLSNTPHLKNRIVQHTRYVVIGIFSKTIMREK